MRTMGSVNQKHHTKSHIISKHIIAGFHCIAKDFSFNYTYCKVNNAKTQITVISSDI